MPTSRTTRSSPIRSSRRSWRLSRSRSVARWRGRGQEPAIPGWVRHESDGGSLRKRPGSNCITGTAGRNCSRTWLLSGMSGTSGTRGRSTGRAARAAVIFDGEALVAREAVPPPPRVSEHDRLLGWARELSRDPFTRDQVMRFHQRGAERELARGAAPRVRTPGSVARPGGSPFSLACSNRLVGVRLPDWWCYPQRCQFGHEWGPNRVIVSWVMCGCPPAVAARGGL